MQKKPPREGTLTRRIYDMMREGRPAFEIAALLRIPQKHVSSYGQRLRKEGHDVPHLRPPYEKDKLRTRTTVKIVGKRHLELHKQAQLRGLTSHQLAKRLFDVLLDEPHLINAVLDD
jgi:hypothetical protein